MEPTIVNALSVDVEEYFQVSAFEDVIDRSAWCSIPGRVQESMERIFSLLDEHQVRATFFFLGWIAERYPHLVRDVIAAGHEVASHGYAHVRVTQQTPDQFRADVVRTKLLLEDLSGREVKGYRAASYSINEDNIWALDVLAQAGYQYSSSIYPVRHDLYGMVSAPRFPFYPEGIRMLEIPISTVRVLGCNIPCGGGGYFRLYPYAFSRWAIRHVNTRERQPSVFYFHPWELDPDQPRPPNLRLRTRTRHYLNLAHMVDRLRLMLSDFHWGSMEDVFLGTTQWQTVSLPGLCLATANDTEG